MKPKRYYCETCKATISEDEYGKHVQLDHVVNSMPEEYFTQLETAEGF